MHWACLISPARAVFTFITLIQLSIPGKRVTMCPIDQSSLVLLSHPSRTTSITTPPWPPPAGSFSLLLKWKTQVLVSKTFLCQSPQVLETFRAVDVTQVVQIWNTCCLNILSKHCERKQTLRFSEISKRSGVDRSLIVIKNCQQFFILQRCFFLRLFSTTSSIFEPAVPTRQPQGVEFLLISQNESHLVFLSPVEGVQFSVLTVLVPFSLHFLQKLRLLVVTFTSPEKISFAVNTFCTSVSSVLHNGSLAAGAHFKPRKSFLHCLLHFSGRAAVDQAYCTRICNVSASASLTAVLNHNFIVSSGREDQTSGNRKNPMTKRHIPEHLTP